MFPRVAERGGQHPLIRTGAAAHGSSVPTGQTREGLPRRGAVGRTVRPTGIAKGARSHGQGRRLAGEERLRPLVALCLLRKTEGTAPG